MQPNMTDQHVSKPCDGCTLSGVHWFTDCNNRIVSISYTVNYRIGTFDIIQAYPAMFAFTYSLLKCQI